MIAAMSEVTHIVSVEHHNKGTSILKGLHNCCGICCTGAQRMRQAPTDNGARP